MNIYHVARRGKTAYLGLCGSGTKEDRTVDLERRTRATCPRCRQIAKVDGVPEDDAPSAQDVKVELRGVALPQILAGASAEELCAALAARPPAARLAAVKLLIASLP